MNIRPQRLQQGDTVGLIALSSPIEMNDLTVKLDFLSELGLRYVLGKTIGAREGFFAGSDEERVADLMGMILDPNIKAIICVRGGYGAARILDKIDYQSFTENPKVFIGFSDVTVLHTAFQNYSELVTFHGPMLSNGSKPLEPLSKKMFQQLFQPIEVTLTADFSPLYTINGGTVQGELTGGNLSRIVSTLGTKFEIDMRRKIVVFEDINESVQDIDRMLNQLRLANKLQQAAGFVIGDFSRLAANESFEQVYDCFVDYLAPLQKPVVGGFSIGHEPRNLLFPLGVEAILDGDAKLLRILPGVE